jgi:hypothetical protein
MCELERQLGWMPGTEVISGLILPTWRLGGAPASCTFVLAHAVDTQSRMLG